MQDIEKLRGTVYIGQLITIEEEVAEFDNTTRKINMTETVIGIFPHFILLTYTYRGKTFTRTLTYVDILLDPSLESQVTKWQE